MYKNDMNKSHDASQSKKKKSFFTLSNSFSGIPILVRTRSCTDPIVSPYGAKNSHVKEKTWTPRRTSDGLIKSGLEIKFIRNKCICYSLYASWKKNRFYTSVTFR